MIQTYKIIVKVDNVDRNEWFRMTAEPDRDKKILKKQRPEDIFSAREW